MGIQGTIVFGYGFLIPTKNMEAMLKGLLRPVNYLYFCKPEWDKEVNKQGRWMIYPLDTDDSKMEVFLVHKDSILVFSRKTRGRDGFGFHLDSNKLPVITPEIQEEANKIYEILSDNKVLSVYSGQYCPEKPSYCTYFFNDY
jgi:hypothetical protein